MPNSDDYQDERDRFRTERNDYRESNRENGNYNRNDNYKRKREESDGYNNNRNGYNSNPPKKPIDFNAPVVYTFKQWMTDQEDLITPENAGQGYKTYRIGERKKHVQQFFIDHKDEEWFQQKYQVDAAKKFRKQRETQLRERFYAWKSLYNNNCHKNIMVDSEHQNKIAKILDATVMLIQGRSMDETLAFLNDGQVNKRAKLSLMGADGNPPNQEDNDDALLDEKLNDDGEIEDGEDGEVLETQKPKIYKSVYIKQLSPKITKDDLIRLGKQFGEQHFVRVAVENISDRKFNRRAWIVFDEAANTKEISYQITNKRIKEIEIIAVAEKDFDSKGRVRNVPGLSNHSSIAFRDLKLAVQICEMRDKILFSLDEQKNRKEETLLANLQADKEATKNNNEDADGGKEKATLFDHDNEDDDEESDAESVDSQVKNRRATKFWEDSVNPIYLEAMKFIQDYEDMYQERLVELLDYQPAASRRVDNDNDSDHGDGNNKNQVEEDTIEIDAIEDIFNVLDPLLLYLRIVHSIDFYAQAEYGKYEDDSSCRCNLYHVRGAIPAQGIAMRTAKDWVTKFENKINDSLLKPNYFTSNFGKIENLSDSEAEALGLKIEENEVELFIEKNTVKMEEEKYLCPISNKKFKGKEYVRKHIMNKHMHKVNEVKDEVAYFNRYVYDSNKDGPLEPRFSNRDMKQDNQNNRNGYNNNDNRGGYRNNYNSGGGYRGGYNRGGYHQSGYVPRDKMPRFSYDSRQNEQMNRAAGGRGMIDYRDLDAPKDDMFG